MQQVFQESCSIHSPKKTSWKKMLWFQASQATQSIMKLECRERNIAAHWYALL